MHETAATRAARWRRQASSAEIDNPGELVCVCPPVGTAAGEGVGVGGRPAGKEWRKKEDGDGR